MLNLQEKFVKEIAKKERYQQKKGGSQSQVKISVKLNIICCIKNGEKLFTLAKEAGFDTCFQMTIRIVVKNYNCFLCCDFS